MPFAVIATSGFPAFSQMVIMAVMAPAAPARVVVTAMPPMAPSAASSEPGLNPYQPTSRMNVPSTAKGMLWPGIPRGLPCSSYLPIRAPSVAAPMRAATPPVMCTMLEPAKSWYGVESCDSQPPPHTQWTTIG